MDCVISPANFALLIGLAIKSNPLMTLITLETLKTNWNVSSMLTKVALAWLSQNSYQLTVRYGHYLDGTRWVKKDMHPLLYKNIIVSRIIDSSQMGQGHLNYCLIPKYYVRSIALQYISSELFMPSCSFWFWHPIRPFSWRMWKWAISLMNWHQTKLWKDIYLHWDRIHIRSLHSN